MIYFLSDAHIGSRVLKDRMAHQNKVIALLEEMSHDASCIYMLGDMFDFYFEYFWKSKKQTAEYQPFLNELRSLTKRGIEIHYFIGNHDIWTFGRLAKETGVIVHKKPMDTILCGKSIYLSHGDGETAYLHPGFKRLRKIFHSHICQFLFRLLPPKIGDAFGYEWAKRSRQKEIDHPMPYRGEQNEELVNYAKKRNDRDYFIFGHRHIELDLILSQNSRLIILGDTFKQWTYAQMDENGNIMLMNYETNEIYE